MSPWKISIRDEQCSDTKIVPGTYDDALKIARRFMAAGWTVESIDEWREDW